MTNGKQELIRRLTVIRSQTIARTIVALLFVGIGLSALLTFFISLFFLSGWILTGVLVPVAILARRWLGDTSLKSIGYRIEKRFSELKGKLVSALELLAYQSGAEGYSLELRDAAVEAVTASARPLNLNSVIPRQRVWWSVSFALLSLAILGGFLGMGGLRAKLGLINGFYQKKVKIRFLVAPGDTGVLAGEKLTLSCGVEPGGIFDALVLELAPAPDARRTQTRRLKLISSRADFPLTVKTGLSYRFRLLSCTSDWFTIRVSTPLTLPTLTFTAYPPAYTRLKPFQLTGPDINLLTGTRLEVSGKASGPVTTGRLYLGTDTIRLLINPNQPEEFTTSFIVRQDAEGLIELAGTANQQVPVSRFYLHVRRDEPPFVNLFLPGRDIDLPLNMQVMLGVNTLDDFGLTAIWLHYGQDTIDHALCIRHLAHQREDTSFYLWDLARFNLLPGDELHYYVRAVDNDEFSGPKSSRSEIFTIRFPTMTEIYQQAVKQTETTIDQLTPLKSEQEKLATELNRISEEQKKSRELSWEEEKRLASIIGEQKNLLTRIDRLQDEIARTKSELLSGMNWDESTLERLNQLQELLSRLIPENLQAELKKLAEKLARQDGNYQQLLQQFQTEQAELKRALEQALKILNRIMEEIRLEALARQASELARQQEELTRSLASTQAESLAERQEKINAGLDSLHQELNKLNQEFSEPAVAESLAKLLEQFDRENVNQLAHSLLEQLRTGKAQPAKTNSAHLAHELQQIAERLNQLNSELKNSRSREIVRQIFIGASDLLTISKKQEELEARLPASTSPVNISSTQQSLLEATRLVAGNLAELGTQTLSLPPALMPELARAMNLMRVVSENASAGNSYGLLEQMRQARASLNRAIAILLAAGINAGQGSGLTGGLKDLLEQLSRMTAEQMGINAGMSGLPIPIPGTGLSAEQLSQLNQILSRQQALREQLEALLKSMGGERPGLTGALDQLVEEMKGVERSLAELQVDRKLIQRQKEIVTRLLDTQRSLRQQGYKEERQAQTAGSYQPATEILLPLDRGERDRLLRAELLRALKQGYPPEYEALIRAYFEMLLYQR